MKWKRRWYLAREECRTSSRCQVLLTVTFRWEQHVDLQWVEANGIRMAYREQGQGSVIIFLHGHSYSSSTWLPQIEYFSATHRAIAYDIRGFGATGAPDWGYTFPNWARDTVGFMDALDIDKAVLCGLSMGGMIAMQVALDAPDRVSGLVLCDTAASSEDAPPDRIVRRLVRTFEEGFAGRADLDGTLYYSEGYRERTPDFTETWRQRYNDNAPYGMLASIVAMSTRGDVLSQVPAITAPTLVIVGEEDVVTPVRYSEQLVQAIPGSNLVVLSGVGHLVNEEDPVRFNEMVSQFVHERC